MAAYHPTCILRKFVSSWREVGMPAEQKPNNLGPLPQVPPSSARLPEAPQPFEHVISLGSSCAVSLFLRQQRLRVYAGPFDWTFSSTRMVAACLDDDFACFLDPAQYAPLRQQQTASHVMAVVSQAAALRIQVRASAAEPGGAPALQRDDRTQCYLQPPLPARARRPRALPPVRRAPAHARTPLPTHAARRTAARL